MRLTGVCPACGALATDHATVNRELNGTEWAVCGRCGRDWKGVHWQAIDGHRPEKIQDNPPVCVTCGQWWPCDVVAPPVEGDDE
jgi:hypothetical protein